MFLHHEYHDTPRRTKKRVNKIRLLYIRTALTVDGTEQKGEKIHCIILVRETEVQKYIFTYHIEGQFHFMFILYLQV